MFLLTPLFKPSKINYMQYVVALLVAVIYIVFRDVYSQLKYTKMDTAEMLKRIDASDAKVTNIVKEITVLKDLILKGGEVSPEIVAAFERLDGHIQQADDLNTDVPVSG